MLQAASRRACWQVSPQRRKTEIEARETYRGHGVRLWRASKLSCAYDFSDMECKRGSNFKSCMTLRGDVLANRYFAEQADHLCPRVSHSVTLPLEASPISCGWIPYSHHTKKHESACYSFRVKRWPSCGFHQIRKGRSPSQLTCNLACCDPPTIFSVLETAAAFVLSPAGSPLKKVHVHVGATWAPF